jgi:hypothetical protein
VYGNALKSLLWRKDFSLLSVLSLQTVLRCFPSLLARGKTER